MDRDRAISRRLTEAIKAYPERPWCFLVTEQPPYLNMREATLKEAPVRLERKQQDHRVREEAREVRSLEAELEALVQRELQAHGRARLIPLLTRLLPELEPDARYQAAGLLVQKLAQAGIALPVREHRWQLLEDGIEVQDLVVERRTPVRTPVHQAAAVKKDLPP